MQNHGDSVGGGGGGGLHLRWWLWFLLLLVLVLQLLLRFRRRGRRRARRRLGGVHGLVLGCRCCGRRSRRVRLHLRALHCKSVTERSVSDEAVSPREKSATIAAILASAAGLRMSLPIRLDCVLLRALLAFPFLLAMFPAIVLLDPGEVTERT